MHFVERDVELFGGSTLTEFWKCEEIFKNLKFLTQSTSARLFAILKINSTGHQSFYPAIAAQI